jgi:F-type H+-transporting ATPase subunit delta
LQLLAENKRLPLLPDIAELFHELYETYQKQTTVKVTSATELNSHYNELLTKSLSKRLQRKISLVCETDPSLLGGAIVAAGDLVIDGSLRGKLNRLLESL